VSLKKAIFVCTAVAYNVKRERMLTSTIRKASFGALRLGILWESTTGNALRNMDSRLRGNDENQKVYFPGNYIGLLPARE
jgi:cation transporter-like permease